MAVTPRDLVLEAKALIKEVDTIEAHSLLGQYVIIDVREYEEFVGGHLPGAINVPRGILEFKIGTVQECANRDGGVLVYCRTSGRAALSAVQLQRLGFSNVVSMRGGYDAWAREGWKSETPPQLNFE